MKNSEYLIKILRYTFSRNPLLYFCGILSLVSVGTEVLAVSGLFPIAAIANGRPLASDHAISRVLGSIGLSPTLKTFILIFLGLSALRVLTYLLAQGLSSWVGKRIQAQLSSEGFISILKFHTIKEIEQKTAGYFIGVIGDESCRVSVLVLTSILFLTNAVLAGLYFIAVIRFSPWTAATVVLFMIVNVLLLLRPFRMTHQLGIRMVEQARSSNSIFVDALNGMRAVKVYSAEDYVGQNYRNEIFNYTRTLFLLELLPLLSTGVPLLLLLVSSALATLLVPASTWQTFDAAFVLTLVAFLMRFFPTVGQCLNNLLRIISDLRTAKDMTAVLRSTNEQQVAGASPLTTVQSVAARDLQFSYDGTARILDGLSMGFQAGRSYAIVGPSGAGKSTLVDLLLKFHAPQAGKISVNNRDLSDISDSQLRKRVILVGQTTTVLNDTVENNIRYGADLPRETIERAATLAQADQFIREMPKGFQTVLTYQGTNLSGGQKQRIGLARALARNPDVLIMDEVTSALDSETRTAVIQNILREYAKRIVIFITHDSYVRDAVSEVIELKKVSDPQ